MLGMRNDEWVTVVFLPPNPTWMSTRNQTRRKNLIVSRPADKPFNTLRPRREIIITPFEFALGNFADADLTISCRALHRLPKREKELARISTLHSDKSTGIQSKAHAPFSTLWYSSIIC